MLISTHALNLKLGVLPMMMVLTARTMPSTTSSSKTSSRLVSIIIHILTKMNIILNVIVAMFYIGSNVVDWPYGAMRGMKDGHHIADHTWSHQMMTTLNNQEVLAELYYTQKAIKMATGVTPRFWSVSLPR